MSEASSLKLSSNENTDPSLQKREFFHLINVSISYLSKHFLVKKSGSKVSEMEMNYQNQF